MFLFFLSHPSLISDFNIVLYYSYFGPIQVIIHFLTFIFYLNFFQRIFEEMSESVCVYALPYWKIVTKSGMVSKKMFLTIVDIENTYFLNRIQVWSRKSVIWEEIQFNRKAKLGFENLSLFTNKINFPSNQTILHYVFEFFSQK